jgi:uncharacterized Zn finger protein (UPF0148 family)
MADEGLNEEGMEAAAPADAVETMIVYGQCSECGCPAYAGEGTYCASCSHHWKSHRAM